MSEGQPAVSHSCQSNSGSSDVSEGAAMQHVDEQQQPTVDVAQQEASVVVSLHFFILHDHLSFASRSLHACSHPLLKRSTKHLYYYYY